MNKQILNSLVAVGLAIGFSGCAGANVELIPSTSLDGSKKGYMILDRKYHSSTAIKNKAIHFKKDLAHSLKVASQMTKKDGFKYFKITHPKQFADELKNENINTGKKVIEYCFDQYATDASNSFLFSKDYFDRKSHCRTIFGNDSIKNSLSTTYRIELYNTKKTDGVYFNADEILADTYLDKITGEKFINDDVEYFEDREGFSKRTCSNTIRFEKNKFGTKTIALPLTPRAEKYCDYD